MSFDFRALCGSTVDTPSNRLARLLMPLGALAAVWPAIPPWAALLGGAALALTLGNPCAAAAGRAAKWLLQAAVVGLGAGVNLAVVARVGSHGLGYTLVGLVATFAFGGWLAGRLGVGSKIGALICAGTGICGGSAIAAVAPSIDADHDETVAALAVVFLLNGIALLVFPLFGAWAHLDAHQFGLWCALAIHDTSSVTGAAMTRGPEALATATTVKLARALWIVPVALLLGFRFRRGQSARFTPSQVKIPWFIGGFVALSATFTFFPDLGSAARVVAVVSHALLTLTLFLIGTGLSRAVLRSVGARPLVHATVLWITIGGATLSAIMAGIIR